jgi:hypothetical protein
MLEPAGRVVMVSGAARGLGWAIADRLHSDGDTLSLGALDAMWEGNVKAPARLIHLAMPYLRRTACAARRCAPAAWPPT